MKTLNYSQLDEPSFESIKNDIEIYKPTRIVFFCETEWEYQSLTKELAELVNTHSIHVIVIFCSYPSSYYTDKTSNFNSIQFIHWSTYWLHWTLMCSTKLNFNIEYSKFEYPFICLNNKNHSHRCALIDELARNNLLDKGIVTWHRFPNEQSSKHKYNFKYYDDSLRFINDDFHTILDSFLIPTEFYRSFLHVVGEATTTVNLISEKTCLPILFKKPFIIMANQGFHRHLRNLGFELYDEIIDYSFDNEPDLEKRAYLISENVKKISDQDYNKLYEMIKSKTVKNYNTYMSIIHNPNYIPNIIKDRIYELHDGQVTRKMFTDPRYYDIGKITKLI